MVDMNDKLHEDLGYIRAKVEKIDSIDDRLRGVEGKMNSILGYATAVSAFFSLLIVLLKDKFSKYI